MKPVLYIANVDEEGFENNPLLDVVTRIAAQDGAEVVAICNKLEAEIAELAEDEKADPDGEGGGTIGVAASLVARGRVLLGLVEIELLESEEDRERRVGHL